MSKPGSILVSAEAISLSSGFGRSLKYEDVFIKACGSVAEARRGVGGWLRTFITRSGCIRRWATGRRVRFSMAKRTSLWTTPPL